MYVEMKNISKSFGDFKACDNVSFGIEQGKLVALLGPSGSGKTTILRMIAGLEWQDEGDIMIDGKVVNDVPGKEREIGFVFQNYALFRYMNVYDNIAYGLKVKKVPSKEIKETVTELIELVGLTGFEKRYPAQLSGGQRQRVAFARALALKPKLLLLDEPFAAIDAKVRKELRNWLKDMISRVGITSIFVTHDQDEAVEVADDILIINEGRLEQMGKPLEIYKKPATPFVAQFIGSSIVLDKFEGFKGFEDINDKSQVVIRPEFVEAFKGDNTRFQKLIAAAEKGTVKNIQFRGNCLEISLDVNGVTLTTNRSLERRPVKTGDEMYVLIYRIYVLNGEDTAVRKNILLKDVNVEML